MNWFAKPLVPVLLLAFAASPLLGAEKGKNAPKGKDKGKASKEEKAKKAGAGELNIPIPIGHGAEGVHIPYYDEKGRLQMSFSIASATRVDEIHLKMESVQIETYNPDGSPDMAVETKTSDLDLNTKIVTSNEPATIRRSDFEITGEKMEFNTKTRDGKMSGKIRMLIYNTPASENSTREQ
jgi:hypothetical protein